MIEVSTGLDVNLTLRAGVGRTYRIEGRDSSGEVWKLAGMTFSGELQDIETLKSVGEVGISALSDGSIEARFPGLARGRYVFFIDAVSEDGEIVKLLNGYIGYDEVGSDVYKEAPLETVRTLTVTKGNEVRRVLFGRTSAAEDYALRAEAAEQRVRGDAELIRKAQETVDALQANVRKAFSIGANGNWFVGGDDTGKPSRGEKGVDADDVQYHVIASAASLPKDAAHCNGLHRYIVSAARLRYAAGYLPLGVTQLPAVSGVYLEGIEVRWSPNARGDKAENFCIAINGGTVEVGPDAQGIYRPIIYPGLGVGVRASVENGRVILSAELPGAAGNGKRVELTEEAGRLAGYDYTPVLSGGVDGVTYDVPEVQYLWTDKGWVAFPLVTPIHAGVDADGLVRLSTDAVVQNGIAIGRNAQGQIVAAVPTATTTQAGIARFTDKSFDTHTTNTEFIPTPRAVTDVSRRIAQEEIADFKADFMKELRSAFKAELKTYFDGLYMAKDAIQVVDSRPAKPVAGRIYLVRE